MTEPRPQNYENHRSYDKIYMSAGPLMLVALILALISLIRHPRLESGAIALLIFAAFIVGFKLRSYAIILQNRIIRLEMRLRLEKLLKGDLEGKGGELLLSQLVGLRFASDSEIPDLTRKILAENITKADEVKRLVKNWQSDHLRV